MAARFDHLVVSVPDLDDASRRWRGQGIAVQPGGTHPGGTVNALVRGPRRAYVELISVGPDADPTWAEQVSAHLGPLGFAVAVDDIEAARAALVTAGFAPQEVTEGSRITPEGHTLRWRTCQVGERLFDPHLPFLIQWTDAMPPGPQDGPVLDSVTVDVPDRDRLVALLRAIWFPEQPSHSPGVTFTDGEVDLWLPATRAEIAEWERQEGGSRAYLRWDGEADDEEPTRVGPTAIGIALPTGETSWREIDGLSVTTYPDVRAHAGHVLLPAVDAHFAQRPAELTQWPAPHPERAPLDEEYSRCLDPGKYRIVTARARAWARALADADLAEVVETDAGFDLVPRRAGALPISVHIEGFEGFTDNLVRVEVRGVELTRLPDCGCDACDDGSAGMLTALDEGFLHALDGGVYLIRDGRGREVTTTFNGWSASGSFASGEQEQWIAQARAGRSRRDVIEGAPWL